MNSLSARSFGFILFLVLPASTIWFKAGDLTLVEAFFTLLSSYIDVLRGYIVIYDRYIWSTFIKYEALGYPVKPIKKAIMLIRPSRGILLDIPVHESIKRINKRKYHLPYPSHVLMKERLEYLKLAVSLGYPIINTYTNSKEEVQYLIRRIIEKIKFKH